MKIFFCSLIFFILLVSKSTCWSQESLSVSEVPQVDARISVQKFQDLTRERIKGRMLGIHKSPILKMGKTALVLTFLSASQSVAKHVKAYMNGDEDAKYKAMEEIELICKNVGLSTQVLTQILGQGVVEKSLKKGAKLGVTALGIQRPLSPFEYRVKSLKAIRNPRLKKPTSFTKVKFRVYSQLFSHTLGYLSFFGWELGKTLHNSIVKDFRERAQLSKDKLAWLDVDRIEKWTEIISDQDLMVEYLTSFYNVITSEKKLGNSFESAFRTWATLDMASVYLALHYGMAWGSALGGPCGGFIGGMVGVAFMLAVQEYSPVAGWISTADSYLDVPKREVNFGASLIALDIFKRGHGRFDPTTIDGVCEGVKDVCQYGYNKYAGYFNRIYRGKRPSSSQRPVHLGKDAIVASRYITRHITDRDDGIGWHLHSLSPHITKVKELFSLYYSFDHNQLRDIGELSAIEKNEKRVSIIIEEIYEKVDQFERFEWLENALPHLTEREWPRFKRHHFQDHQGQKFTIKRAETLLSLQKAQILNSYPLLKTILKVKVGEYILTRPLIEFLTSVNKSTKKDFWGIEMLGKTSTDDPELAALRKFMHGEKADEILIVAAARKTSRLLRKKQQQIIALTNLLQFKKYPFILQKDLPQAKKKWGSTLGEELWEHFVAINKGKITLFNYLTTLKIDLKRHYISKSWNYFDYDKNKVRNLLISQMDSAKLLDKFLRDAFDFGEQNYTLILDKLARLEYWGHEPFDSDEFVTEYAKFKILNSPLAHRMKLVALAEEMINSSIEMEWEIKIRKKTKENGIEFNSLTKVEQDNLFMDGFEKHYKKRHAELYSKVKKGEYFPSMEKLIRQEMKLL